MTFDGKTFESLGINPESGYTAALTPNFRITLSFSSGPPPEELSAVQTGLPMANVLGQMLISGNQTATSDVNNHMFGLMAGDGEEAANSSLSASLDEGVVIGQGDGPEDPIAHKVLRSRQWEVYTTVNYGYLDLNALGGQAGVNVESWAPGIGIERHLSRGLAVGFAVSFLQSWQDYSGGLGSLDLEGPALSTYLTFVRKNYWSSLLYSFGSYELDSTRNPGLGFPQAYGSTHSYTNSVQYNTGGTSASRTTRCSPVPSPASTTCTARWTPTARPVVVPPRCATPSRATNLSSPASAGQPPRRSRPTSPPSPPRCA
jgi:hypothetical protein